MDQKHLYACLLLLTLSAQAQLSQQTDHIILTLQPTPSQQSALDSFTTQLQDPASPNYHKFLTPPNSPPPSAPPNPTSTN